tara:strand:- start:93 stop:686 length:594 start_codon:yes stop_codon:yes gene_type:complete
MGHDGYYAKSNPEMHRDGMEDGILPVISQNLDSIRAYQWEVHFRLTSEAITGTTTQKPFTLAAKQVSQIGFTVDDIAVHRVNDIVYYPGKASPEEMVITFDNIRQEKTGAQLYRYLQSIYNPLTGEFTSEFGTNQRDFKRDLHILQLDSTMEPLSETWLFGAYPKTWKLAEFNYSTNEFHTVEVTFRFDFLKQTSNN